MATRRTTKQKRANTRKAARGAPGARAAKAAGATISAIELLEQDHREVEAYFEAYDGLRGDAEKAGLARKICAALKLHTRIEEEIFYPAARAATGDDDLLDEAVVEHAGAKRLIDEIEAGKPGDDLFDAKVKVLGEQIRHHVEEEEDELFPEVKTAKLDLDALGKKMALRKADLMHQADEAPGSMRKAS